MNSTYRGVHPVSVMVIPRPTAEDAFRSGNPVELDLEALRSKFDLRLSDAAKSLGISITSLKQVCRKLGVARWPRRMRFRTTNSKPWALKHAAADIQQQQERSMDPATLPPALWEYKSLNKKPWHCVRVEDDTAMATQHIESLTHAPVLHAHIAHADMVATAHGLCPHTMPWTPAAGSTSWAPLQVGAPYRAPAQQQPELGVVQKPSMRNVGLFEAPNHIQQVVCVETKTVSSQILETRREIASLMALQALQRETSFPPLQSLFHK